MFLIMYFMYILNIFGNIDCMVKINQFIQYNRKYMKKKNRKIDKFLLYPSTLLNEQIEGYYWFKVQVQNSGNVIHTHDEGHAFFVSAFILRLSLGYKNNIVFTEKIIIMSKKSIFLNVLQMFCGFTWRSPHQFDVLVVKISNIERLANMKYCGILIYSLKNYGFLKKKNHQICFWWPLNPINNLLCSGLKSTSTST